MASCFPRSSCRSTIPNSSVRPWPTCSPIPSGFIDKTLADPLEGRSYGPCKAKIRVRPDGSLYINSFAHGGMIYELRADEAHGVSLDDFYAYMPLHNYIFAPTSAHWPASSVNARIAPIKLTD